jgi:YfiH family protein
MNLLEQHQNGVTFFAADGFTTAGGVCHGFSTRMGGVSEGIWSSMNLGISRGDQQEHVRGNYRHFYEAIGFQGSRMVMSRQVHGDRIRVITSADGTHDLFDPLTEEADGLMTDVPGIMLTVFSADCIPILLYDPERRVIAALHAGWRGTSSGIVTRAVEKMTQAYDCRPEQILAAIGPGIGQCHFETHEDVPNAMTESMGASVFPFIKTRPAGKFNIDLKGINADRLERAGLWKSHIAVCELCTACQPELFWSHRIHGTERGSQAAMIALRT